MFKSCKMGNRCIDCFKEIKHHGRRCKECHIKNIKKPEAELSNFEVLYECDQLREKIKINVENLIIFISSEIDKVYELTQKFKLNKHNSDLLNKKISKIIGFKERLFKIWNEEMKQDEEQNTEELFAKIEKECIKSKEPTKTL